MIAGIVSARFDGVLRDVIPFASFMPILLQCRGTLDCKRRCSSCETSTWTRFRRAMGRHRAARSDDGPCCVVVPLLLEVHHRAQEMFDVSRLALLFAPFVSIAVVIMLLVVIIGRETSRTAR